MKKMCAKVWLDSKNDPIRYESLTERNLKAALTLMKDVFFTYESISIGVELNKHPEARDELEEMCVKAAEDGVSMVAVEKSTEKIVGAVINKLHKDKKTSFFAPFSAKCAHSSSKALLDLLVELDEAFDVFEYCNADCLFETMFLATRPECSGRGIGKNLLEVSIELAQRLKDGEDVRTPLNEEMPEMELRPTVVIGVQTSFISHKLMEKLGFTNFAEFEYKNFTFKGRTLAERIGPQSPHISLGMRSLN